LVNEFAGVALAQVVAPQQDAYDRRAKYFSFLTQVSSKYGKYQVVRLYILLFIYVHM